MERLVQHEFMLNSDAVRGDCGCIAETTQASAVDALFQQIINIRTKAD